MSTNVIIEFGYCEYGIFCSVQCAMSMAKEQLYEWEELADGLYQYDELINSHWNPAWKLQKAKCLHCGDKIDKQTRPDTLVKFP